jgi:hypothetical protein
VILGAHYDSRFYADEDADPDDAAQPVAGANDGASGWPFFLNLPGSFHRISIRKFGW